MGTEIVTLCGLCGQSVKDFYYKVPTSEGDKVLCLGCAGMNTIQQLSDVGFIDAPEEIMSAHLFVEGSPETPLSPDEERGVLWDNAKKRHGIIDEPEETVEELA